LLEARDKPGGRAYEYEESGFIFDTGPNVITAPQALDELFELVGKRREDYIEFIPVKPFYRLHWEDGTRLDYEGGEEMLEQLRALSPDDMAGYARFVDYARRVFNKGYDELAAEPFLRFSDMVRVAPSLAWLRADRSVYATVSRFVKNDHLRQALSFHSLLVGGNPFDTSAIYTLIHYLERKWGVFFPRGGTGALIRGMVRRFEELGGELRLSSPVTRVEPVGGMGRTTHRVSARGWDAESFDLVASNADIHHTYSKLYRGVAAADRTRKRLERLDWSMSLFVLYFGTDRSYADEVCHHTVVFGPRYKELLDEIFGGSQLPEDFSLYL